MLKFDDMNLVSLIERVRRLKVGQSITVETESERTQSLNAAKMLRLRITTRKLTKGGFTVTRLPEDPWAMENNL